MSKGSHIASKSTLHKPRRRISTHALRKAPPVHMADVGCKVIHRRAAPRCHVHGARLNTGHSTLNSGVTLFSPSSHLVAGRSQAGLDCARACNGSTCEGSCSRSGDHRCHSWLCVVLRMELLLLLLLLLLLVLMMILLLMRVLLLLLVVWHALLWCHHHAWLLLHHHTLLWCHHHTALLLMYLHLLHLHLLHLHLLLNRRRLLMLLPVLCSR